ncbi:MarR family winged helix-turn-helix transcriptional regulator [Eupransor demetentiae]|uniref:MarR family (MarR) n=1 Tax=Eupransor demetentiae TaxID=3109584 RepID=A0ABM9N5K4_9LACO|nr:DNA-binding transcriptional regulator [Lactobacillaceae bacterium LMG 33000]
MTDIELFRLIGTISRTATREVNQAVKQYDLDNNLFLYLLRILEKPGLTQFELIQLVQVDKTTMSRALKKLLDRGYIRKETDPQNKNFKRLFPTEEAVAVRERVAGVEKEYVRGQLGNLSEEQKEVLGQILELIVK